MKTFFIIDKKHHLLVKKADSGDSTRYFFPSLPMFSEPSESPVFHAGACFNFRRDYSYFPKTLKERSISMEIVLVKQQIAPEMAELFEMGIMEQLVRKNDTWQWIDFSTFSPEIWIEIGNSEHLQIPREHIRDIYASVILSGFDFHGKPYQVWHFCNNQPDADKLVELVRVGTKRGTASLYDVYACEGERIPQPGDYSVVTNFEGIPQVVIQTVRIDVVPFHAVSEDFARIEGEGDKSLAYWQQVHMEFFTEESQIYHIPFTPNSQVILEQFDVVFDVQSGHKPAP